jgi:hypothetical protein
MTEIGRMLSNRINSAVHFDLALSSNALFAAVGGNFFNGGSGLGDGNWHHVIVTSRNEGGTNIARMFVDGNTTSIANTTAGSTTIPDGIDWLIGHQHGANNTDWAFGAYSNMWFAHLTAWNVGFTRRTIGSLIQFRRSNGPNNAFIGG